MVNSTYLLVASRMADRLHEAENGRLGRLASRNRPERSPRSIAVRLAAAGHALRAPAEDCGGAKIAERPA